MYTGEMFVIQVTFLQTFPLWKFKFKHLLSEILFLLQQMLWCCSADINSVSERCLGNTILQCFGCLFSIKSFTQLVLICQNKIGTPCSSQLT